MAQLANIIWRDNDLIYDTINSIEGVFGSGNDERNIFVRDIRGSDYRVCSQPAYWKGASRGNDSIDLSSVLSAYSTWTLEILMRTPHPTATGAIILFPNDTHYRIWDGTLDDGLNGTGAPVPPNKWVNVTIRCNGVDAELYYDGVLQNGSMPTRILDCSGSININRYADAFFADVEIAEINIWDEYRVPIGVADDLDWQSDNTLSGAVFIEEADAGNNSEITVTASDAIDISFPGTVCWGCLEGPVRTQYDFRGIINRDIFILGTGHISHRIQLISIFQNYSRTDVIARIYVRLDVDYITVLGVRADLYDDGGSLVFSHDFSAGFDAEVNYSFRLGRNGDTYYFMYAGEEVTYVQANVSEDRFMMGLNMGVHYGEVGNEWHIRYSDIVLNQTGSEPLPAAVSIPICMCLYNQRRI